jgi:hypothetical protein
MENILIGIIKSFHPVKLKQNLIAKIILTSELDKFKLHDYLRSLQNYYVSEVVDDTPYTFEYNPSDKSIVLNNSLKSKVDIVRYSIEFYIKTGSFQTTEIDFDDVVLSVNLLEVNLFNMIVWLGLLTDLGLIRDSPKIFSHVNSFMNTTKISNYNMPLCIQYAGLVEHQHIANEDDLRLCIHTLVDFLAKYRLTKNEINPKYSMEYFNFYFHLIIKLLAKLAAFNDYTFKATILSLLNVLKQDSHSTTTDQTTAKNDSSEDLQKSWFGL